MHTIFFEKKKNSVDFLWPFERAVSFPVRTDLFKHCYQCILSVNYVLLLVRYIALAIVSNQNIIFQQDGEITMGNMVIC